MSGQIFINYRRDDAQDAAGRLYDRLEQEFPAEKLFMDVDRLGAGVDFVDELRLQVAQCDVFLAIMGPHWLNITDDESGLRRLDNPNDWVRIEIADALARDIRVIPVLVNDAPIPREDQLPGSMAMLARRNAVRLTHERFRTDAQGLIEQIHIAIKEMEEKKSQATQEAELTQKRTEREAKEQAAQQAQAERETAEAEQLALLGPERFEAMREHNNWSFIQDKNDIGKLRDHLARFPGGETVAYAMEKLEPLVWAALGDAPDKAALEGYLREFEQAPHAQQAQAQLVALQEKEAKEQANAERAARENTAWQAVKGTSDAQTLAAFLRDWPNGGHRDEAKRLQKALKGGLVSRRSLLIGGGVLIGGGAVVAGGMAFGPSVRLSVNDTSIRTFKGHSRAVTSIAFSADGRKALSGSLDDTLKLWNLASGKLIRTFKGHSSAVYSVAFSPDGRKALSGSYDSTLKLWDLASGKPIRTFKGHSKPVTSIAFSPDGRKALSGSRDDTLKLWDLASGKPIRTFKGHSRSVTSIAFSPDGRKALSGSRDKTLKLWDVTSGAWF